MIAKWFLSEVVNCNEYLNTYITRKCYSIASEDLVHMC